VQYNIRYGRLTRAIFFPILSHFSFQLFDGTIKIYFLAFLSPMYVLPKFE